MIITKYLSRKEKSMALEKETKRRCIVCGSFLNRYNQGDQCLHHNRLKADILPVKSSSVLPTGRVGGGIRATIRMEYGTYMN